jgi:hypothetical protein
MIQDYAIQESADQIEASTSVAEVLAVVAAFNGDLGTDAITGDILEKLKEWLNKLVKKLKEFVAAFQLHSFTITVGTRITVSVAYGLPPA